MRPKKKYTFVKACGDWLDHIREYDQGGHFRVWLRNKNIEQSGKIRVWRDWVKVSSNNTPREDQEKEISKEELFLYMI